MLKVFNSEVPQNTSLKQEDSLKMISPNNASKQATEINTLALNDLTIAKDNPSLNNTEQTKNSLHKKNVIQIYPKKPEIILTPDQSFFNDFKTQSIGQIAPRSIQLFTFFCIFSLAKTMLSSTVLELIKKIRQPEEPDFSS